MRYSKNRIRRFLLLVFLAELFLCYLLLARTNSNEKPGLFYAPPGLRSGTPKFINPPEARFKIKKSFSFKEAADLTVWEEKVFRGKTAYTVTSENGETFLRAKSEKASSGLYLKSLQYDLNASLYLSWTWRATAFPKKEYDNKLSNREEDDFAARIYVVFPGSNFFDTDVMEYIWDEKIPAETWDSSPFSGRVKLFVVRNGTAPEADGGWVTERRNVYDDYVKLYGRKPTKPIGAIAFMSDSDNTKTASGADLKEIHFLTKQPAA